MTAPRPHALTPSRRLTRAQALLEGALLAGGGVGSLAPGVCESVGAALGRLVGAPCRLEPRAPRLVSCSELLELLPEPCCGAVLAREPGAPRVLVVADAPLALELLDRVLGGDGKAAHLPRPLVAAEAGVLSYVVLELLCAARADAPAGAFAALLCLERLVGGAAEVVASLGAEPGMLFVPVALDVGGTPGTVSLLVPLSLLTARGAADPARRAAWRRSLLEVAGPLRLEARVELDGAWTLSPADLLGLAPGDVVLLGCPPPRPEGAPAGLEVSARLGRGRAGALRCRLHPDDPNRLELVALETRATPEDLMLDAVTEAPGPHAEPAALVSGADVPCAAAALLEDVPAPVAVELGRLSLTVAQLVALEPGRILRFNRTTSDPVALALDGRLVARGELVEVDGELGVRVIALLGARP
jgi:type III secretion system YscQ/HrcQ family protein